MCICVDFEATLLIPPGRWGWNQGIKLDVEMKEGFAPTMEKFPIAWKPLTLPEKVANRTKILLDLMNPSVVFTSPYYKLVYSPFCCDKILI